MRSSKGKTVIEKVAVFMNISLRYASLTLLSFFLQKQQVKRKCRQGRRGRAAANRGSLLRYEFEHDRAVPHKILLP